MGKEIVMKTYLKAIGETDTWITPKYITDALGEFDLDPCAHTNMPWQHATNQYTVIDDGLIQPWKGRVWLNPPFNRYVIGDWMEKMAHHKDGIVLVSFAGETERFKRYVWGKAKGVLILDHRPYFCKPDGTKGIANSGQTMCLIAYDDKNLKTLIDSRLGFVVKEIITPHTNGK